MNDQLLSNAEVERIRIIVETILLEKGIDPNEEIWVNSSRAKQLLSCQNTTLWKLRNDPSTGIETSKTGKTILYRKSTLIAFIENNVQ